MLNDPLRVLVDTVLKLQRRGHHRHLQKILRGTRPTDVAGLLRHIPERERVAVFNEVEELERRAEILAEIGPDIIESFVEDLTDEELTKLLEEMQTDDTVDVLEYVPAERKHRILRMMRREEMDAAEELLAYDPETAGGLMVPDFLALDEDCTVDQAIVTLRDKHEDLEMAFYVYVINEHHHLVGVLSLRDLVVSSSTAPIKEIMESEVIRVQTGDDQEVVAKLVARHNLLALPVVDDNNRLLGIVTVDDVIDVIREEATEDMFKMAGAGSATIGYDTASVFRSTKSRLPWLFASWVGGVGASFIIHGFEDRLVQLTVLAAFIPVIIGMGGNIGTQTLTIVTRSLALGQIVFNQLLSVLWREMAIGLICGLVYGTLLGITAFFLGGDSTDASPLLLGVTIGVSLCAAMVIATGVGGSVPLILQKMSIDPAVATGPFVTTSVDVLGILVYFGVATLLLGI